MHIKIIVNSRESFVIQLSDSNTVKESAEKIVENKIVKKYHLCIHSINLKFLAEIMRWDKKLSDYEIEEGDCIEVQKKVKEEAILTI